MDYKELCHLDVLGLSDTLPNDQSSVYAEFKEQLVRHEEGWYETGLPWRGNHPVLPNNKDGSLRRLASLNKKLENSTYHTNLSREPQQCQRNCKLYMTLRQGPSTAPLHSTTV